MSNRVLAQQRHPKMILALDFLDILKTIESCLVRCNNLTVLLPSKAKLQTYQVAIVLLGSVESKALLNELPKRENRKLSDRNRHKDSKVNFLQILYQLDTSVIMQASSINYALYKIKKNKLADHATYRFRNRLKNQVFLITHFFVHTQCEKIT